MCRFKIGGLVLCGAGGAATHLGIAEHGWKGRRKGLHAGNDSRVFLEILTVARQLTGNQLDPLRNVDLITASAREMGLVLTCCNHAVQVPNMFQRQFVGLFSTNGHLDK